MRPEPAAVADATIEVGDATIDRGVVVRSIVVDGRRGMLWSPELLMGSAPLVLVIGAAGAEVERVWAGHVVRTYGVHVASIPACGRGERTRFAEALTTLPGVDPRPASSVSDERVPVGASDTGARAARGGGCGWRAAVVEVRSGS